MNIHKLLAFVILLIMGQKIMAQDDDLEAKIKQILPPNINIVSIGESAMPGVKVIDLGRQTIFAYQADDFLLIGEAFDTAQQVSLLDEIKSKKMKQILAGIDKKNIIHMGNKNSDHSISVWTDVDCGYCRKLHFETVPKLIDAGVQVKYILWPRTGINNQSYEKAVSVFCAEDQVAAMTDAKAGKEMPERSCENPLAEFYKLGIEAGVRGTPTIVLENDKIIPGYVTADVLLSKINN